MRVIRRFSSCLIPVVAALGMPHVAQAQTDSNCGSASSSAGLVSRNCLYSTSATAVLGVPFPMQAKHQVEITTASGSKYFADDSLTLDFYVDSSFANKTVSTNGWTPFTYTFTDPSKVGNRSLTVKSGFSPHSNAITVNVQKYTPLLTVNPTATALLTGQSMDITFTVNTFAANGQAAFYLRRPGSSTSVEWATRQSLNYPAMSTIAFSGPFSFSGINATPGSYVFSVGYLGDAANFAVTSPGFIVKVGPYPTTISLAQSVATSMQGKPVTLTATVTPTPSPIAAPTGTVQFFDGTILVGFATLTSGTAVLTSSTNLRAVGSRSLTAVYSGDAWNSGSTSAAITHTTTFDPALLAPILIELLE